MKDQLANLSFTLCLLVCVSVLLVLTLDLGRIAALVPHWVAIFTLGLLLVQVVLELTVAPLKHDRRTQGARASVLKMLKAPPHNGDTAPKAIKRTRKLHVALIFLSMAVAVYLLGILIAVPLYAFFYWRWRAGEGWRLSLVMAGTMMVGLYVIFVRLLEKAFYKGQLALWLGF
jgi:hypothetical protein